MEGKSSSSVGAHIRPEPTGKMSTPLKKCLNVLSRKKQGFPEKTGGYQSGSELFLLLLHIMSPPKNEDRRNGEKLFSAPRILASCLVSYVQ